MIFPLIFLAALGLYCYVPALVSASRGCSLLWRVGLAWWMPLSLQSTGSRACELSNCGAWA